ncbi:hypothetical protein H312_00454 [Anncaliia algerae PRA339]|uniref:Uncharacterized protein n=1 Tax=Anncaliia algerae PRA339 TaxID=1288291 RepID=A0A059F5F2_9MICR|nr:hypothetical protein H312_00454 [Anncaliia algerae PRA339]
MLICNIFFIMKNMNGTQSDVFTNYGTFSSPPTPYCNEISNRGINSIINLDDKSKEANRKITQKNSCDIFTNCGFFISDTNYSTCDNPEREKKYSKIKNYHENNEYGNEKCVKPPKNQGNDLSLKDSQKIRLLEKSINTRVAIQTNKEKNLIEDVRLFALIPYYVNSEKVEDLLIYEYETTAFFIQQYPPNNISPINLDRLLENTKFFGKLTFHFQLKGFRLKEKNSYAKNKIKMAIMQLFSLRFRSFFEFVCFFSAVSFITRYFDQFFFIDPVINKRNIFRKNEKFRYFFHVDDLSKNHENFHKEFFYKVPNFTFEDYLNYLFADCLEFQDYGRPMLNAFVFNFRRIYLLCYFYNSQTPENSLLKNEDKTTLKLINS